MTPDPYGGSAKATDPGSWNRYAYVGGDPVNFTDHAGLEPQDANCGNSGGCFPGSNPGHGPGADYDRCYAGGLYIPCPDPEKGECIVGVWIELCAPSPGEEVADKVPDGVPAERLTRDEHHNLVYTNEVYGGPFTSCDECLRVSDPYAATRPNGTFHGGIDLATNGVRGINALSLTGGVVTKIGATGFGAHSVTIQTPNGTFFTYGHLASNLVKYGDTITAGTPLGEIGNVGKSTGTHLHIQASTGAPFKEGAHMLGIEFPYQ